MWPAPLDTVNASVRNPVLGGANPWVTRWDGEYLWCFADGDRGIAIHRGPYLNAPGPKRIVWTCPDAGPYSQELRAPELHHVGDRWYIYFSASGGSPADDRGYVLVSSVDDPAGPYEVQGPLYTGDDGDLESNNRRAEDFTLLELGDQLFGVWSGWDSEDDGKSLYIAKMSDPVTVGTARVKLAGNADFDWELVTPGGRGLNEAPQALHAGNRVSVVYSAGPTGAPGPYLGRLELRGDDPMNPSHWLKDPQPMLASSDEVPGIGHACTVTSPDGVQHWLVYHAQLDEWPGQGVHIQPYAWHRGRPVVGSPRRTVPAPRGTGTGTRRPSRVLDLTRPSPDSHYLGHHQLVDHSEQGMTLGRIPDQALDVYRAGEKVIFTDPAPSDLRLSCRFHAEADQRDVGVLFRVSEPTIGYDCQLGYFAGVIPEDRRLLIGCTDGSHWRELVSTEIALPPDGEYTIEVAAKGPLLTASVGSTVLQVEDRAYQTGNVGLRVVDSLATFEVLEYEELH